MNVKLTHEQMFQNKSQVITWTPWTNCCSVSTCWTSARAVAATTSREINFIILKNYNFFNNGTANIISVQGVPRIMTVGK